MRRRSAQQIVRAAMAGMQRRRGIVAAAFVALMVTSSGAGETPAEPAELVQLRAQYEQRREAALRPLYERFQQDLETLLRQLLMGRRAADALVVQRFKDEWSRSGRLPDIPERAPIELQARWNEFSTQSANALRPLAAAYQRELTGLQTAYLRRGDTPSAIAVGAELERLKPPPARPDPIDWERERKRVKYQYEHQKFYKGTFDYSDRDRSKLLDGKTGDIPTADTVVWRDVKPPRIRVEFPRPVQPNTFRIYMFGGGRWNMQVSPEIRVLAGAQLANARLIGRVTHPEDRTSWIAIPLKPTAPEQVFWIEMEDSPSKTIVIDEIAFD